ncbi:MAG TPA: FixH family protein [Arenimonas sp.]|uniref:FixH family protein n=1 Tax=Arenimonas sp. TaxID=1872635 RepID=UPI002B7E7FB3|nr:FixH family protein [Arenimonas sp.]HMB56584.1 FixH family protein [Arenimonas sp.]
MNAATAWYRQQVLWLAIALPALILVALASTLAIALAGSSDAAPEPVQRTADSQVSDLAPDARAQQLGLLATLQLTPDGHDVRVVVRPAPTADIDTLTLQWVHPIQAAKDVEVSLRRDGDGWRGHSATPLAGRWRLRLQPQQGEWRLVGRLAAGEHDALLQSALSTP